MAFPAGTQLGPYKIVSALGAGGMGEVYRASDTRLGRDVAIKILPPHLAVNPGLRERFEREAKAISRLAHPNICALHDIGRQDGIDFLVLECLEGGTLEDRIARGPIPSSEALKVAVEIADALDQAHQNGIVHRDLKPANIMLTKAGAKLMDFGLARHTVEAPIAAALTEMTAEARKLTAEGSLIGTFQYMAPEQLEGQEADARTDIFALGTVMYEMVIGKPAFQGRTKASLIAAILTSDPPPLVAAQPMTPPALDRVVHTCLAKAPAERFQSAHDLKLQLEWIAEAGSQAGVPAPVARRRKHREGMAWAVALVLLLAAVAGYYLAFREHSRLPVIAVRSSIEPPAKENFVFTGDNSAPPIISPDGTRLVFAAVDAGGTQQLWLRRLNALTAEPISGTRDATFPFWSHDSQKLAFFAEGKLKSVDLSGGLPQTICAAPNGRGGTWNIDNVILFAPGFRTGLYTVAATGGTPTLLMDQTKTVFSSFRWPQFMPDGKHFLFVGVQHEQVMEGSLFFASLGDHAPKLLMKATAQGHYASGRLFFLREATLMSQDFDAASGKLSGEPSVVADEVLYDDGIWRGVFDASDNGLLVYEHGVAPTALAWFDRNGKQLSTLDIPTGFETKLLSGVQSVALSRDRKFLAVQGNPSTDIWNYDLARGLHTRLTFDPVTHTAVVFSPDDRWVAYTALKQGANNIYRKAADGAGSEEPLLVSPKNKYLTDWSPDGKYILFEQPGEGNQGSDIWALPLGGDRKPFPLVQSPFNNAEAVISPDGKWMAYSSDDAGREEVYVTSFPQAAGKWQVSQDGALTPRWSVDGKELFFVSYKDNRLMAAQVSGNGGQFAVGAVKPYFQLPVPALFAAPGDKFLSVFLPEKSQPPLTLITNWTAEVKK
jgi:serine/threonine protein kinase/WD40 repeat protein